MTPFAERPEWTQARKQRLAVRFPELSQADPDVLLGVDTMRAAQGQAPSDFSITAMRLASVAAENQKAE